MTRINTNISALSAQKSLANSQGALTEALTRLSTGLRINVGKDDPAGLIASEVLRADITATGRAITNSERANQVIATADSALGQVSALLNDIRGLVTEAANEGALSDEQIAANQLQIDSSLEAINRIAQMTQFQGRKLLDGSLNFQTTAGTNFSDITDMEITQANLGTSDSMTVDIRVDTAATKAEIKMDGSTADSLANADLTFGYSYEMVNDGGGQVNIYSEDGTQYNITWSAADNAGVGDDSDVTISGSDVTITMDTAEITSVSEMVTLINTTFSGVTAGKIHAVAGADGTAFANGETGAVAAAMGAQTLNISADTGSEGTKFNNMEISFEVGTALDSVWTDLEDRSTLVITLNADTQYTMDEIITEIETNLVDGDGVAMAGELTGTAGAVANAAPSIYSGITEFTNPTADTEGSGGGVLLDTLVVQLTGETGSEFLNFGAGTQMTQIAAAVNAISDTLGMVASVADGTGTDTSGTLVLQSSNYGSAALIDVDVVSEGTDGTFEASLTVDGAAGTRDTGTDIDASVNGSVTLGNGNTLTLSTAMLDLEATIAAGVEKTISFTIDSGGAMFQLGPDVVSTQQARLGIQGVNAAQLRGTSGRLYQLGSGQSAALTTSTTLAASIVEEVIGKVTSLRGRLGAFQKTTLDPNIATLNDTLVNLTDAESSIRDADFASETAALTRAQILVQSGMSVLSVANSNPQNVLALLR